MTGLGKADGAGTRDLGKAFLGIPMPVSHPLVRLWQEGAASQVGLPRRPTPPLPRSSLGVDSVLGHCNLGGHQEEDVSLEVHHGLLLGLLG